ncbi:RNA polymerase sigma factor SigJ [Streptomyces candidus]|uniref:RNA polymerase sigma-70 factor (ECF subfamily) n=1 Tax=Streptomyces candidus TaxID=67283 RepID=A0A7X0HIV8_9ACTN|nr:RNA polymerase sigma factor SigJ [Streptomyces candidus]MBB6437164.1 RNA polymerase sigma-70 factor (ECF subfamily) [Streptomyces candidus]GHH38054.1 RNA polymerase sigma24 factor [Streptomyces candidus]
MAETAQFETHRAHLRAVAYRITGSVSDAEDAVQEAWLRWHALDDGTADNPRAYLTTTVSRICYDQLTSARARRERYVGPWLPEPLVAAPAADGPEERATLDESVSTAVLALLETLTPAQRTAFVLHDVFDVPFPEIAEALGKSPAAVRQLASQARKHVRDGKPRRTVDRAEHRRAVDSFLAAVTGGADLDALLTVLDPQVVWRSDGGGVVTAARKPLVGAERVAQFTGRLYRDFGAGTMRLLPYEVNGAPGLILDASADGWTGAFSFTVGADGRITGIDVVVNPEKLRHLDIPAM